MDILCTADLCPVILNSTCVFYEGNTLLYTGITTNDSLQTALQKIDAKFGDAMVGYTFIDGVYQSVAGAPVGLGGNLTTDITIGGNYTLTFAGNVKAAKHITTGGTASQFVKGDGTLDGTAYQAAGNYITALTGDVIANGPGSATASLAVVNSNPGTYGSGTRIPVVTVDTKGRVTALTTTAINVPSGILSFVGDVYGSGSTGSPTTLTLENVNTNVYTNNTFLKFKVNAKGLVTGAAPVTHVDIEAVLGYVPTPETRKLSINGVQHDLQSDIYWTIATGVSGVTASAPLVSSGGAVPNISITKADAATDGYLDNVDWVTFNSKQAALNGTGLVRMSGTTVSYDNAAYTPQSRTLTINGTSYDLSADRSWTINSMVYPGAGIAVSTGTGWTTSIVDNSANWNTAYSERISSSSSPLSILNHVISIAQAGAAADGYLSSTDWNTFNNKQPAGSYVTTSRTISTTGPLQGGGDLSADRTFSITQSGASADGYLSSTDWNTFNNKQASGSYITELTGEATASGPGSATVTLSTPAVTGKLLTGVNISGGSVVATDTILEAFGKVQNQINGLIGGSMYKGTWDAATNTPTITSGVGTTGWYYIVSVPGTTNIDGITDWNLGDWIIFDGTAWQQVDNTDAVVSVNGYTGAVNLVSSDVPEGLTNLYYTPARARTAISLTTTGTSGAATYDNITGVLNIPNYNPDLSGYVPITRTLTINGTSYDLSANRSWTISVGVAEVTATSPLFSTGGAYPDISIQIATTSQDGYLSATDWNTFNAKQGALILTTTGTSGPSTLVGDTLNIPQYQSVLTNPITGLGTTNYVSKFTSASSIGDSNIQDSGSLITLGSNTTISSGSLGIGSTSLTGYSLRVSKNITGAIDSLALLVDGTIQSDVTRSAFGLRSELTTQAASFNLTDLVHISAAQKTLGAGSSITSQFGFYAYSSLTGATNNYGFFGNIGIGTGRWNLYMQGTALNYLAGSLGIGSTSLANTSLRISRNATGGTQYLGVDTFFVFQSDVTATAVAYNTNLNTQAASFTLSDMIHFRSAQGTIGAGSTVTSQYGFFAQSNLIGATNNYGFYGQIASGANRWNLYMAGTANNYLAGSLGIGTTSLTGLSLAVTKNITGATTSYGIVSNGTAQSDVTSQAILFGTVARTQATTYTLSALHHFSASQGTFGAGSSVNTQRGFFVESTLIGATNNHGFFGDIPAGTGRWNIYMSGTAQNYLAGALSIGVTTANASALLQVDSTTKGFLPPRMTAAQRAAIATPAEGLVVFQTDGTIGLYVYANATWRTLAMV